VGAFLTGLLAAMVGFGMMAGSSFVASVQPRRRGLAYVAGSGLAMVVLVGFALSPWYAVAAGCLLVAASGMGLFGSTQSTLVMTAVEPELRGRALGLLSTAIGVLPLGMIALGELAEVVGARAAIVTSAVTGLVALVAWLWHRPDVLRLTAS
jgi:MFS family permease